MPQHWIFCHGMLNPETLVQWLGSDGMTFENLRARLRPAKVAGFKRGFAGSYSSLMEAEGSEIQGLAVQLTSDELSTLDQCEGYPHMYRRIDLQITDLSQGSDAVMQGQAYQHTEHDFYIPPSHGYKIEVCKMIFTSRYLAGERENRQVELPVVRAADEEVQENFQHELTDDDVEDIINGLNGIQ